MAEPTFEDYEKAKQFIPGGNSDADHAAAALEAFVKRAPMTELKLASAEPLSLHPKAPVSMLPAYQSAGIEFIKSHFEQGCIVADDLGLGKTVQAVIALARRVETKLVLCPAVLRHQWANEIVRWSNQDVWVCLPKSLRGRGYKGYKGEPWIVAYYADAEQVHREDIGYAQYILVLDEAHNLRGAESGRLQRVQGVANFAAGRVLLTGSPLVTDGARTYPLLNLAQPGTFGTYYQFTARYCGGRRGEFGWEVSDVLTNASELRARLSHFSYRRTRDEVESELPFETKYTTVWLEVAKSTGIDGLVAVSMNPATSPAYMQKLNAAKSPLIAEHLLLDQAGSLTFTYMIDHAEQLAKLVKGALCITGKVPALQRLGLIQKYVKECERHRVVPRVIATLDSIAEGANLQWAKSVNFAALDYSAEKMRQGIGRMARIGNVGKLNVRIFAARRSFDEPMFYRLIDKLKQSMKLVGSGHETEKAKFIEALSDRQLAQMASAMLAKYKRDGDQPSPVKVSP